MTTASAKYARKRISEIETAILLIPDDDDASKQYIHVLYARLKKQYERSEIQIGTHDGTGSLLLSVPSNLPLGFWNDWSELEYITITAVI